MSDLEKKTKNHILIEFLPELVEFLPAMASLIAALTP